MIDIYEKLGDKQRVKELLKDLEEIALHELKTIRDTQYMDRAIQYVQLVQFKYLELGDFQAASEFSRKIGEILGDSSFFQTPEAFEKAYGQFKQQDTLQ